MLPAELEDLILDYYWSHKMYRLKKKMHRELIHDAYWRVFARFLHYLSFHFTFV